MRCALWCICSWVMEIGLAWSGGSVGKGIQGACAPMAGLALLCSAVESGEGYAIGGDGLPNGCGVLCRGGQPATTSGVAMYIAGLAVPACRRHPGRRNTGLRTAATASGVAEMSAFGHRLRLGRGRCAAAQRRGVRWCGGVEKENHCGAVVLETFLIVNQFAMKRPKRESNAGS